jgi:hypothetical protein
MPFDRAEWNRQNRTVQVRLNDDMMDALDSVRGRSPRGTYLRELLDRDPAVMGYRKWLTDVKKAGLQPPEGMHI